MKKALDKCGMQNTCYLSSVFHPPQGDNSVTVVWELYHQVFYLFIYF